MAEAWSGGTLPSVPSRDNYAWDCDPADLERALPGHIEGCVCATHTGVCQECGYKVTIGPSGTEYGHARANNRGPGDDGVRRDCPHRPLGVNPGEPHAWDGYDGAQEVADD